VSNARAVCTMPVVNKTFAGVQVRPASVCMLEISPKLGIGYIMARHHCRNRHPENSFLVFLIIQSYIS
jgi:L-fucose isomerase-like protein